MKLHAGGNTLKCKLNKKGKGTGLLFINLFCSVLFRLDCFFCGLLSMRNFWDCLNDQ